MSEALIDSQNTLPNQVSKMSVGAMLRAEREARGASIEDVSEHLHNSPRQINALENDQFEILPEPMITRGFIRNYARLLGIDAEPLLQAYRAQVPGNDVHSIDLPSANIVMAHRERSAWMRYGWLSIFIFILVAIWFVYMEFIAKSSLPKPATTAQNVDITATQDTAPEPVAIIGKARTGNANVANTKPELESAKNMEALPSQTASTPARLVNSGSVVAGDAVQRKSVAIDAKAVQLKFVTSEKSWINVLDRDNKPIFNKIKQAAREDQVEGQPPFKLTLGNARATQVFLNGKLVDLQPYTKGNVAHLTLQ